MRNNSVAYSEYLRTLERDGVTIDQELLDVLDVIQVGDTAFFYALRSDVSTVREHLRTGKPIIENGGKRILSPREFLATFIGDPAVRLTSLVGYWPQAPTEDKPGTDFRDAPDAVQCLAWIYYELRTVMQRLADREEAQDGD